MHLGTLVTWQSNRKLFTTFLLLVGFLNNVRKAESFGLQAPMLLYDNVFDIDEQDASFNFRSKLIHLLSYLPSRRHCQFINSISRGLGISFTQSQNALNVIGNISHILSKEDIMNFNRHCHKYRGRIKVKNTLWRERASNKNTSVLFIQQTVIKELSKLYNNLPVPFKCEALQDIGWKSIKRYLHRSSSETNKRMSFQGLSQIIQKTEGILKRWYSVVSVAPQCNRILSGRENRYDTVLLTVDLGNLTWYHWLRQFRRKIIRVCGKYAVDKGIEIPDEVYRFIGKQEIPYNAYHLHILNHSTIENIFKIQFHIHLIKEKSDPLEANFVISALEHYGYNQLLDYFKVKNITYNALIPKRNRNSVPQFSRLRSLFPSYLRKYFISLRRRDRCIILHIIAQYSNNTIDSLSNFLSRKRVKLKFTCAAVDGKIAVISKATPAHTTLASSVVDLHPTVQGYWPKYLKTFRSDIVRLSDDVQDQKIVTPVEITMFIILGMLFVVSVVFVIVCLTYCHTKRKVKRQLDLCSLSGVQDSQQHSGNATNENGSNMSKKEHKVEITLNKVPLQQISKPLPYWKGTETTLYTYDKAILALRQSPYKYCRENHDGEEHFVTSLEPIHFSTDDGFSSEEEHSIDGDIGRSCPSEAKCTIETLRHCESRSAFKKCDMYSEFHPSGIYSSCHRTHNGKVLSNTLKTSPAEHLDSISSSQLCFNLTSCHCSRCSSLKHYSQPSCFYCYDVGERDSHTQKNDLPTKHCSQPYCDYCHDVRRHCSHTQENEFPSSLPKHDFPVCRDSIDSMKCIPDCRALQYDTEQYEDNSSSTLKVSRITSTCHSCVSPQLNNTSSIAQQGDPSESSEQCKTLCNCQRRD